VLKKKFRTEQKVGGESGARADYWKRRPSEIKGYQKAYYVNDSDGSYLRVDYHLKEKKLRLYLEDASEGGIAYYAVIANGKIQGEKNLATGRSANLNHKFTPRADVLATIPQKDVLALFGDNYGMGEALKSIKEAIRRKKLEHTRERYFREEKNEPLLGTFHPSKRFRWFDAADILLGAALAGGSFLYLRTFVIPGVIAALYGVAIGAVDILIRQREPLFTKIILFIGAGVALYVYGRFFW
jgi:hypothetical protein